MVDIEFVFAFKLHITPLEMWEMPFYDIMLLFRRYEQYVEEENENQKAQEESYRDKTPEIPDYKNFSNDIQKQIGSFDANSISKGFSNGFSMPSLPSIPGI